MSGGVSSMDIRLPMGLMFTIIGAIITIYGMMTGGDPMYDKHSLGINMNLWWGAVMTLFGVVMFVLAILPKKDESTAGPGSH